MILGEQIHQRVLKKPHQLKLEKEMRERKGKVELLKKRLLNMEMLTLPVMLVISSI